MLDSQSVQIVEADKEAAEAKPAIPAAQEQVSYRLWFRDHYHTLDAAERLFYAPRDDGWEQLLLNGEEDGNSYMVDLDDALSTDINVYRQRVAQGKPLGLPAVVEQYIRQWGDRPVDDDVLEDKRIRLTNALAQLVVKRHLQQRQQ